MRVQASSGAVLRGYRPSYREALQYIRMRLDIRCPSGLATEVRTRRGPDTAVKKISAHKLLMRALTSNNVSLWCKSMVAKAA